MTKNKQQTVVDSVIEYFSQYVDMKKHMEEIEQFKEMEKERIKRAWVMGLIANLENPFDYNFYQPLAEAWYNETYGGNFVKCTCKNELEYSNCDIKCERIIAEQF